MAAITLVTMAILVQYSLALTQTELTEFASQGGVEQNSNIQGTVTISTVGNNHRLVANGIPDHNTGTFPGTGNPNSISSQNYDVQFPKDPVVAAQATCLPMGPIAFTKNGIPMYNPYNSNNQNAVEGPNAETFDLCDGHPDQKGSYHYHQGPKCVLDGTNDQFIGVAMDGFPIYGSKDSSGTTLTSADLDACHGQVDNGQYRYRLTADFPYIMACFKGTPNINQQMLSAATCMIISSGTTPSPTQNPGSMSTPLPNGMSTPPPNGMSTPPPNGMSTPPPNGMSTPPPNGMSTPPPNGMSTPPMGGMSSLSPGGTSPSGLTMSGPVGGTSSATRISPMLPIVGITLCVCLLIG